MSSSLTVAERKSLRQCEADIQENLESFIKIGNALKEIRDRRLYTDVDDTFEGYVKKRWNFSRQWAYQQISSTEAAMDVKGLVVQSGDDVSTTVDITRESHARELSKIETPHERAKVVETAVRAAKKDKEGNPVITASVLRKAAQEVTGTKPKEKPKERTAAKTDTEGSKDAAVVLTIEVLEGLWVDAFDKFWQACPADSKTKIRERINVTRGGFPPTADQVFAYCVERKNKVDADTFVDFYASKNWMVGKNKMKDWKAAVRNWERRSNGKSGNLNDDVLAQYCAEIENE